MGSVNELEATLPWVVGGVEGTEQRPVSVTIYAATEQEAKDRGRRLGIVVKSVRAVGERPKDMPVWQPAGTKKRKSDGFVWFWLVSFFLVAGLMHLGDLRLQAARYDGVGALSPPTGVGSSGHSLIGLLGSLIFIAAFSALPAGLACMAWGVVRRPSSATATRLINRPAGRPKPPKVATEFPSWPRWKLAVAAGAVVFVLAGLFPPFQHVHRYYDGRQESAGYGFVLSPPEGKSGRVRTEDGWVRGRSSVEVDLTRLLIEWAVVVAATAGVAALLRKKQPTPDSLLPPQQRCRQCGAVRSGNFCSHCGAASASQLAATQAGERTAV